jgi:hypothetical protein
MVEEGYMTMNEFPESDWKLLRKVYDSAFSRFCESSVRDAESVIDEGSLSPSDKFDKLCKGVRSNQKKLNSIFYSLNYSHSNAIMILITLYNWELLSPEELNLFSQTTQARVRGGTE